MTILDELAALARERHYGHGERELVERALCYLSKIPVEWCLGCKRGWHKFTQQPVRGSEPEEIVVAEVEPVEITPTDATPPEVEVPTLEFSEIDLAAGPVEGVKKIWADRVLVYDALEQSLKDGVDHARDPDYCPRCTPLGFGACRCDIASNE